MCKRTFMLIFFCICAIEARDITLDFSSIKKRDFYATPLRATISKADNLVVRLPVPHGDYLLIETDEQSKQWHYIVEPYLDKYGTSGKAFRNMKQYVIRPGSIVSEQGKPIFGRSGVFRLIIGSNLETDAPKYEYIAELKYVD